MGQEQKSRDAGDGGKPEEDLAGAGPGNTHDQTGGTSTEPGLIKTSTVTCTVTGTWTDLPRYTDLWVPLDWDALRNAGGLIMTLGVTSSTQAVVEVLSYHFVIVMAGTVSTADVVALRITEGLMWSVVLVGGSILEAVSARAVTYVGRGRPKDASVLMTRSRNIVWAMVLSLLVACVLMPATVQAFPFLDECDEYEVEDEDTGGALPQASSSSSSACGTAVSLAKPITVVSLCILLVDMFRQSDQMLLRTRTETVEPLLVQAVSVMLGSGLGWWLVHDGGVGFGVVGTLSGGAFGGLGMGTMGAIVGRGVGALVCASGMRWLLERALEAEARAAGTVAEVGPVMPRRGDDSNRGKKEHLE